MVLTRAEEINRIINSIFDEKGNQNINR
jgi:hypothetical protein